MGCVHFQFRYHFKWSPKLFALYMNGLTNELCKSYAGCYINDKCIKHIMYADYICLMASTGIAMQNLLDVTIMVFYFLNVGRKIYLNKPSKNNIYNYIQTHTINVHFLHKLSYNRERDDDN